MTGLERMLVLDGKERVAKFSSSNLYYDASACANKKFTPLLECGNEFLLLFGLSADGTPVDEGSYSDESFTPLKKVLHNLEERLEVQLRGTAG